MILVEYLPTKKYFMLRYAKEVKELQDTSAL